MQSTGIAPDRMTYHSRLYKLISAAWSVQYHDQSLTIPHDPRHLCIMTDQDIAQPLPVPSGPGTAESSYTSLGSQPTPLTELSSGAVSPFGTRTPSRSAQIITKLSQAPGYFETSYSVANPALAGETTADWTKRMQGSLAWIKKSCFDQSGAATGGRPLLHPSRINAHTPDERAAVCLACDEREDEEDWRRRIEAMAVASKADVSGKDVILPLTAMEDCSTLFRNRVCVNS